MMTRTQNPDPPVHINPDLQLRDLLLLKRMLLFTLDDERYLNMAGDLLADQTETILDHWYAHFKTHPYAGLGIGTGEPEMASLEGLRLSFRQWLHTLCHPPARQDWLQQLHTRIPGPLPDQLLGDMPRLPAAFLRYLVLFIYPITHASRAFLAGHAESLQLEQAWFKAISLSTVLWLWPDKYQP